MIIERPDWMEWAEFDGLGFVIGLRDDAPPEIKDEYEAHLERQRQGEED